MRRRRSGILRLVIVLAVVAAAAVYFFKINPIYDAIHKGLDLQGGFEIVFQASSPPGENLDATDMAAELTRTVGVLELRVNGMGVSEPVIEAEPKTNRILVQIAGVKNPDQAQQTLGQTADLEFKDEQGNVIVRGADLSHADAEIDTSATDPSQKYVVALQFDKAGAAAFASFTAANQGKTMGIFLDGKNIESPTILAGCCPNGQSQISGNFATLTDAQNFAVQLNSGALPLTLTVISKNAVSATLGADSVSASKLAALVAIALVAAFMFLLYRVPGLWADVALLVYALLMMGVLVGLNATLTVPGVTGMILSVGMAVDSNVIIFERIKEELREGRVLRSAVDEGFKHGLRAILDSNATTLIAAMVLYYLGSTLIRGFAVTLGIGVIISLLTAVVFTRYLLRWLVDAGSRPSWWFFAERGVLATAPAGATPSAPAAARTPAAAGPAGASARTLTDLRRMRPAAPIAPGPSGEGPGAAPEGQEAPVSAQAPEVAVAQEMPPTAPAAAPDGAEAGPRRTGGSGKRAGKRRPRRGGR